MPECEATSAEKRLQRRSQKNAPPLAGPSQPEPGTTDAFPALIRRNRPQRRTADARGRRPDRFVLRGEPHPEASASRNHPIRPRIAANSGRGTATSASWNTTYFACITTFAPILTSFSRRVVRLQVSVHGAGVTAVQSGLGIGTATRQPLRPSGTQVDAPASMRTTPGLGDDFLHESLPSAWPHPTRRQDASACRPGASYAD